MRASVRCVLRRIAPLLAVAAICLVVVAPVFAQGGPQPPEGFVPVTEVPASEQLPAAPLVMGAYAFVWVVLVVYLWSIARRLTKVQAEIDRLVSRLDKGA